MLRTVILFFIASISLLSSCKKEGFISAASATLQAGVDTLRFDTVFTRVGSVTKSFTLVNNNEGKLRITQIKLGGGNNSPFKVNVNGSPGSLFSNLELNANDSLYVFVKVTVDPTQATNPFVLLDSLEINVNGNTSMVYLQAFGQNARMIGSQRIITNTTWNNALPYVITGNLEIAANTTLTIEKGTRIYVNARAAFVVNGNLVTKGEKDIASHVVFTSDRLEPGYRDLPGGWPGLVFTPNSRQNELTYTDILHAYQGIVVAGGASQVPARLQMRHCQISNAYDIGLYGINTSITASNCLFSQCGNDGQPGVGGSNVLLTGGGKYQLEHCTLVTYANLYQNHKQPACFISNTDGGATASLQANFTNCIVFGQGGAAENELQVQKAATDAVVFTNCLYKVKSADPAGVVFTNCIRNSDPLFDSVSTGRQQYNFRLKPASPLVNAATNTALLFDLDGNPRVVGLKPDIGSYEVQ